jgi:hypothetical protein
MKDFDRERYEIRLTRRWPKLGFQDLGELALGEASLLEVLMRHYEGSAEEIEAEIAEFDSMTPPPDLA